jgi:hypothetical protein
MFLRGPRRRATRIYRDEVLVLHTAITPPVGRGISHSVRFWAIRNPLCIACAQYLGRFVERVH